MRICWVTSNVWYSYLLRWMFNAKTSHVGAVFNTPSGDMALDINNPLGKLYTLRAWVTHYKIVEQVEISLPDPLEIELFQDIKTYVVGKEYDVKGYYWGMFCGLMNKLFWIPLPKKNKYSEEGKDMCQEILRPIVTNPIINLEIDLTNLNAMTPDMALNHLKEATKNNPKWVWITS